MQKKYSSIELSYGVLFFIFHLCIEVVSYALFYLRFKSHMVTFLVLLYDFFAFCPQLLVGDFYNRNKKINIGLIGAAFFVAAILLAKFENINLYILSILILAIGNAFLHVCGAIAVASVSKNKIFPSSLFVAGGTFGIIIGRYLANINVNTNYLFIPIIILALISIFTAKRWCKSEVEFIDVDIVNKKYSHIVILLIALIVVMVRSYMGFVIPINWKSEFYHSILLFTSLGIGKALGGLLCDKFGYKFVATVSTLFCVPFIIIGKDFMFASLFGMLLFSMTMSITYAMALSIIKNNPGVAFGVTTIGLFLGVLPLFVIRFETFTSMVIVVILSVISYMLLNTSLMDKNKNN